MRNMGRIVISCRLNVETQYDRPNMNPWNNLQKRSRLTLSDFCSARGAGSPAERLRAPQQRGEVLRVRPPALTAPQRWSQQEPASALGKANAELHLSVLPQELQSRAASLGGPYWDRYCLTSSLMTERDRAHPQQARRPCQAECCGRFARRT